MALNTIDAALLKKCFLAGAQSIESQKEYINELNVFPVPDGDTGTNMSMTIMAAAAEVHKLNNPDMESLCKAISGGSLRGARGNSGVILSQLLRGFTKEVKEHAAIDTKILTAAFNKGVETAYRAVMKPKEGTILTVARGGAEKASELEGKTEDIEEFMSEVIAHMEEVLAKTPDMLPVLKEAGVVDSGGQGLVTILKGAYDAMMGKEVKFEGIVTQTQADVSGKTKLSEIETADIKYGYCTEFIIMVERHYDSREEAKFKSYLESIGDSIVVVSDDDIIKVHVHTNDPGMAIQKALTYGSLTKIKIDNMREEHNERLFMQSEKSAEAKDGRQEEKHDEPRREVGFIAVSTGEGINEIFKGLGADCIIEGGQTMNPSTEDMLNAINSVNADNIFILPNNSNIILAAQQAKALTEDKNIVVIPSKTVPQGITALINYVFDKPVEENEQHMVEEMLRVKTGQVTYAVRDTNIDGKEIRQGDIMGLDDKTIVAVGTDIQDTAYELISKMVDDESELISIYYGEGISEDEASALACRLESAFPQVDVDLQMGGQPVYYYVMSVE